VEVAEGRAHVLDEQIGCFEGGEVAAARELDQWTMVWTGSAKAVDGDVVREDGDAGGQSARARIAHAGRITTS
jgi:hypothetical protein